MNRISVALIAVLTTTVATSAEWAVIGAGNATCAHWNQNDRTQQAEIIGWMSGFASSENLSRASSGKPEYRLEFLTPDYLRSQIKDACSADSFKNVGMLEILLKVLLNLPTAKAP